MKSKWAVNFGLLILIFSGCKSSEKITSFMVNYSKVVPGQIGNKQMAILEPDQYTHMDIMSLKSTGTKLIGYVSLGEVNKNRWYYAMLKERGFLGENKNWGSYYINLKDSASRDILLNKVITNVVKKGFDGLFLDTIDDVAPYTDRGYLQPYMVELIRDIHTRYPGLIIIQNAGLFLLDKTHSYIDGDLIEDVASSYQFSDKSYQLSSSSSFKDKVQNIMTYKKKYHLPFFIVDYANNQQLKNKITARLDTLDIPFFIGNISLN